MHALAATVAAASPHAAATLRRGELVGRYVVLAHVGQGGMGVVYAAYDPELDRKVALKLLLTDGAPEVQLRLLREAKAMAQLSHPNVVAIHDVGAADGRVFLAMEFVDGETLSQWIGRARRRWREVVALFLRAGEGLQAAHAVGLVHRDFKPDNVMIGVDGRVRVMDFGLARAGDPASTREAAEPGDAAAAPDRLTRAGGLVGTPQYMAPEQWAGAASDARTDQFCFCVALWEALHGRPPFAGETVLELSSAVQAGKIATTPAGGSVPGFVRKALLRGLAVDRAQRFPSMAALLAALSRDPSRRNRVLVVSSALVLALGGVLGWVQVDRERRTGECDAEARAIFGEWDDATQRRLRDAMVAAAGPAGGHSFDRASPWLGRYVRTWFALRRQSCLAAVRDGTVEAKLAARTAACLDERRGEFSELVASLQVADRNVSYTAVSAAASLPDLSACTDPVRHDPHDPAPTTAQTEAAAVRRAMARVAALVRTGRYKLAAGESAAAEARAESLGLAGLLARVRLLAGEVAERNGDYANARAKYEAALLAAGALGDDETAARAATGLTFVVGFRQAEPEPGRLWAHQAEMWRARQQVGADDLRRVELLEALAQIERHHGDPDTALTHGQRVLEIRQRALGPGHPDLANSYTFLGNLAYERSDLEAAIDDHRRALALQATTLGLEHPSAAFSLNNLGNAEQARGQQRLALGYFLRAVEIAERTLGPEHPQLASLLNNVASAYQDRGDNDAALRYFQRALAIWEKTLGGQHTDVAIALNNLGLQYSIRGSFAEAERHLQRAHAIWERVHGPENARTAHAVHNLGELYGERGEVERALTFLRRALAVREKVLTPNHRDLALTLQYLGRAELARGRHREALAHLERALAIETELFGSDDLAIANTLTLRGQAMIVDGQLAAGRASLERALALLVAEPDLDPLTLGQCRFALARALSAAGGDRAQIHGLVLQARDGFHRAGKHGIDELAATEAWLAAEPARRSAWPGPGLR